MCLLPASIWLDLCDFLSKEMRWYALLFSYVLSHAAYYGHEAGC